MNICARIARIRLIGVYEYCSEVLHLIMLFLFSGSLGNRVYVAGFDRLLGPKLAYNSDHHGCLAYRHCAIDLRPAGIASMVNCE